MTQDQIKSLKPGDLVYWIVRGDTLDKFVLLQYLVDSIDHQMIFVHSLLDSGSAPWEIADFPMAPTVRGAIRAEWAVLESAFKKSPTADNQRYLGEFYIWIAKSF